MLFVLSYLSFAVSSVMAFSAHNLLCWAACKPIVLADSEDAGTSGVGGGTVMGVLPTREALSLAVFAAFALALCGARAMYWQMGMMAKKLGDTDVMAAVEAISWWRVAAAFWVTYALVPVAAVITLAKPTIDWAGIRYRKSGGKVVRIN
jgi:hypothetical protein